VVNRNKGIISGGKLRLFSFMLREYDFCLLNWIRVDFTSQIQKKIRKQIVNTVNFMVTPCINNIQHFNPFTPNDHYMGRTAPLTSRSFFFYIFIHQIYVQNILNMLHILRFFYSKCRLFHNANISGSCIIHILNTGCAKI